MESLKHCARTSILKNFDEEHLGRMCWNYLRVKNSSDGDSKPLFHPIPLFYEFRELLIAKLIGEYYKEYIRSFPYSSIPCDRLVGDGGTCILEYFLEPGIVGVPSHPDSPGCRGNTAHDKLHDLCISAMEMSLFTSRYTPDEVFNLMGENSSLIYELQRAELPESIEAGRTITTDSRMCERFYIFFIKE